jgi:dihydroorotate dehydrogenase (NAD+) catalytic subunit
VYACARAVDLPIVGMGGVRSGLDALELVAAGATAVALGTVLFGDPHAPGRVRAELAAEASARRYDDAEEARGIAQDRESYSVAKTQKDLQNAQNVHA